MYWEYLCQSSGCFHLTRIFGIMCVGHNGHFLVFIFLLHYWYLRLNQQSWPLNIHRYRVKSSTPLLVSILHLEVYNVDFTLLWDFLGLIDLFFVMICFQYWLFMFGIVGWYIVWDVDMLCFLLCIIAHWNGSVLFFGWGHDYLESSMHQIRGWVEFSHK